MASTGLPNVVCTAPNLSTMLCPQLPTGKWTRELPDSGHIRSSLLQLNLYRVTHGLYLLALVNTLIMPQRPNI